MQIAKKNTKKESLTLILLKVRVCQSLMEPTDNLSKFFRLIYLGWRMSQKKNQFKISHSRQQNFRIAIKIGLKKIIKTLILHKMKNQIKVITNLERRVVLQKEIHQILIENKKSMKQLFLKLLLTIIQSKSTREQIERSLIIHLLIQFSRLINQTIVQSTVIEISHTKDRPDKIKHKMKFQKRKNTVR